MNSVDPALEIGGLADLDLPALQEHWRELYGSEPPVHMSRELMVQAVAYRIQENRFGGLSRAARLKLAEAAAKAEPAGVRCSRRETLHRVKPGTRFLREWQGETYEVTATVDGRFFFRDRTYGSLSEIARLITGTRWSGPAFFGFRQHAGQRDGA